ncbi:ubiquitinyl hydrolase 1 [Malassezia caprae]|uniref:Ubiquitinyl hydrolase 1 n=1 Tax=Malassezia caprae TaxID=1381934 RepID=A0AAF0IWL6_9BASI|nr:ubiquitinyl hydrolase 1 [Malassezia caprae]
MSLLVPTETRIGPPKLRPPPPPLSELDAQVAAFRHQAHFSNATPVSQWIRLADRLKRQADQHHNAGDLEHQYLCLAKCAKILDELLPREHRGWARLDDEHRAHVAETAEMIRSMVQLSRDAILEARQELDGPSSPSMSCSPKGRSPGRSSLRHTTPDTHDTPSKRVSFAVAADQGSPPPYPLSTMRTKLPWHRDSARYDTAQAVPEKAANRRKLWVPRLHTKDSMSFLGPVAQEAPPPTPPPAPPPDPPRRPWRRPRSERRFLTADPVVSLSVAPPGMRGESPASPTSPTKAPADTLAQATRPESEHPMSLRPAMPARTVPERLPRTALRPVHLPHSLPATFLECAEKQLAADTETCGLLLGHVGSVLCVTHLLLPPQNGTSVSCHAEGEEQVLAYQMEHDLVTLGWIHTHPTQTCFLSSLDLHTQASYQALLPEAVAVVCAPLHEPSVGVYRLTQPSGLQYVLQCTDKQPFHPHEKEASLYLEPHVYWDRAAPLTVVDQR